MVKKENGEENKEHPRHKGVKSVRLVEKERTSLVRILENVRQRRLV